MTEAGDVTDQDLVRAERMTVRTPKHQRGQDTRPATPKGDGPGGDRSVGAGWQFSRPCTFAQESTCQLWPVLSATLWGFAHWFPPKQTSCLLHPRLGGAAGRELASRMRARSAFIGLLLALLFIPQLRAICRLRLEARDQMGGGRLGRLRLEVRDQVGMARRLVRPTGGRRRGRRTGLMLNGRRGVARCGNGKSGATKGGKAEREDRGDARDTGLDHVSSFSRSLVGWLKKRIEHGPQ